MIIVCNFGFQPEGLNRAFLDIFEELLVLKKNTSKLRNISRGNSTMTIRIEDMAIRIEAVNEPFFAKIQHSKCH